MTDPLPTAINTLLLGFDSPKPLATAEWQQKLLAHPAASSRVAYQFLPPRTCFDFATSRTLHRYDVTIALA